MKHFITAFFIFALIIKAGAESQWTQKNVHEALKPFLTKYSQGNPPPKNTTYWTLKFPTNQPRDGYKKPWAHSSVTVFSDKKGKVHQLTVESYGCKIDESLQNKEEVRNRFKSLAKLVSKNLFSTEYEVSDNDFKALGPDIRKMGRITIKKPLSGVKKMKLRHGMYKCDGKRGYGYRLDFFL